MAPMLVEPTAALQAAELGRAAAEGGRNVGLNGI